MTEDKEAFLERWSRRKLQQAEEQPAPPAVAERKEEPVVALPPVEELTPQSDFAPFMNPKVDDDTRRSALKKLFSDAHFNVADPFEAYSGDYTKSEPIPELMLAAINKARDLAINGLEEAKAEEEKAEPPTKEPENPAGKQDA